MSAALAIGMGVNTVATNNIDAQTTTAFQVFFLIGSTFPLSEAWSKQLTEDQAKDFDDNMQIANDPAMAAKAAADYQKYTIDSNEMEFETGKQNNLLQEEKSQVRTLGNAMDQVYTLEGPMVQFEKALTNALLGFN